MADVATHAWGDPKRVAEVVRQQSYACRRTPYTLDDVDAMVRTHFPHEPLPLTSMVAMLMDMSLEEARRRVAAAQEECSVGTSGWCRFLGARCVRVSFEELQVVLRKIVAPRQDALVSFEEAASAHFGTDVALLVQRTTLRKNYRGTEEELQKCLEHIREQRPFVFPEKRVEQVRAVKLYDGLWYACARDLVMRGSGASALHASQQLLKLLPQDANLPIHTFAGKGQRPVTLVPMELARTIVQSIDPACSADWLEAVFSDHLADGGSAEAEESTQWSPQDLYYLTQSLQVAVQLNNQRLKRKISKLLEQ